MPTTVTTGSLAQPAAAQGSQDAGGEFASPQTWAAAVEVVAHPLGASPGSGVLPTAATAEGDVPQTALVAYQRAALVMASAKPGCHLDWSVLAAIGQIESDHGRSGGAVLAVDGTSSPAIRGPELDGRGWSRVPDTDGGQLDGDASWDRAVGPMQFLPSTWMVARVDGDGDGQRSADDIDDASLAAAVYLCAWGDDLATSAGMRAAVRRYNQSAAYVSTVISLTGAYRAGGYVGFPGGLPGYDAMWAAGATGPTTPLGFGSWSGPDVGPASLMVREHLPATEKQGSPVTPSSNGTTPTGGQQGSEPPVGTDPPEPSPSPTPAADPVPVPDPSPTPDPEPDATATPTPDPSPPPADEPSPSPEPPSRISGTLESCGDAGYCVDGNALDLGPLDGQSSRDYDGDGVTESRREELDGLIGTNVDVEAAGGPQPGAVQSINGLSWP